jgi:hypothetical protein
VNLLAAPIIKIRGSVVLTNGNRTAVLKRIEPDRISIDRCTPGSIHLRPVIVHLNAVIVHLRPVIICLRPVVIYLRPVVIYLHAVTIRLSAVTVHPTPVIIPAIVPSRLVIVCQCAVIIPCRAIPVAMLILIPSVTIITPRAMVSAISSTATATRVISTVIDVIMAI